MPIIPGLRKLRQQDSRKVEGSLGHSVRPCIISIGSYSFIKLSYIIEVKKTKKQKPNQSPGTPGLVKRGCLCFVLNQDETL